MICAVCYGVLRGHQGSQWRGTFDLHFDHHANRRALKDSADMSCCICRSLFSELERLEGKDTKSPTGIWAGITNLLRRLPFWVGEPEELDMKTRKRFISAYLSEEYGLGQSGIYRLDFKLRDSERVGTFALQQLGAGSNEPLHTPFSHDTSSDEVLVLAKEWLRVCTSQHEKCRRPKEFKYPSRVIDLGEVIGDHRVSPKYVRLVLQSRGLPDTGRQDRLYVTLSHCWGDAKFISLTKDKLEDFQKGILIDSLPRTFQDAVHFARRLGKDVRYIWIDSLCIIQDSKEDWLAESAQMYQIYNNSHCNISATAAANSEKGLYSPRVPHELWEDDINLNVEGIPGHKMGPSLGQTFGPQSKESIQRCRILDLSFWERNVDDAPVNRRGWVLQERLMAPRVLHFCQGQIAWECRELVEAESSRGDLPIFRLKSGGMMEQVGLKVANKRKAIPTARFAEDPRVDLSSRTDAYDDWSRIVEVYSRTRLTKPMDKLIALSGIAKMVSAQIKGGYIAGMWRNNLASQLLWRVDPVWEDDRFHYRSTRPDCYRAPSFSWAAVDAEKGLGIKYGEIIGDDDASLLIEVEEAEVSLVTDNEFGLIENGHLILSGVLQKVEMKEVERKGLIRYEWNLVGMSAEGRSKSSTFSNVYLDSPSSDIDILGPNGCIYCVPARIDSSDYLICLLLQLERINGHETGNFRRIGLTKVPPYDKTGQGRVRLPSRDEIPHAPWVAGTLKHAVRIV